jgi:hypothetical protein
VHPVLSMPLHRELIQTYCHMPVNSMHVIVQHQGAIRWQLGYSHQPSRGCNQCMCLFCHPDKPIRTRDLIRAPMDSTHAGHQHMDMNRPPQLAQHCSINQVITIRWDPHQSHCWQQHMDLAIKPGK